MKYNEDIFNQVNEDIFNQVNEDIFNQAKENIIFEKDYFEKDYDDKRNDLRNYLSKKYQDYYFPEDMYLCLLYKWEVDNKFSEQIQKRFYRIWKYGPPKICPINKFIQSPTLF